MFFRKSLKGLSDEELMSRFQGGNERALEEVYHRYSRPLLRYFYRMLWQDTNKAEDFLHDLFVKIAEKPERFDVSRKFSTWVYSVAHNMCKNEYRRQAFRAAQEHIRNGEKVTEPNHSIDHESFQKKLDEILNGEDEETRDMFYLRHSLDMTFLEIGEVLRLPEGTVKSRLFFLKKKIATALDYYKVILEK